MLRSRMFETCRFLVLHHRGYNNRDQGLGNIPNATRPISKGGPSAGLKLKLTSPSSSPFAISVTLESPFPPAAATSATKSFRVMLLSIAVGSIDGMLMKLKKKLCGHGDGVTRWKVKRCQVY